MSGASPPVFSSRSRLLGRERERELLDRLLEGVRDGRGGVLVMHGEAGVGKTALLDYAAEAASRFRIARTAGVEAEMELPSAVIQQLCAPFYRLMERPRSPSATRSASRSGSLADPRRMSSWSAWRPSALLAEAAEEQPLLCVVTTRSGSIVRPRGPWPLWTPSARGEGRAGVCGTGARRRARRPAGAPP
jgi:hypothetical protein